MFQRDRFVEDCREGVKAGQKAIREIVLEAVGDPAGIIAELGEPTKAGVFPLYCGSDATVICGPAASALLSSGAGVSTPG